MKSDSFKFNSAGNDLNLKFRLASVFVPVTGMVRRAVSAPGRRWPGRRTRVAGGPTRRVGTPRVGGTRSLARESPPVK